MNYRKPSAAAEIIADRMLLLRPESSVCYRTRINHRASRDNAPLGSRNVNLRYIYPNAKDGDFAFVSADLLTQKAFSAVIWASGCDELYIADSRYIPDSDGLVYFELPEGRTRVDFKCTVKSGFCFAFCVSIKYYPKMAARDYLVHVRVLCPQKGCENSEGFAVSALCGERGSFAYPERRTTGKYVDFNKLYPNESGNYAYALMYAREDGEANFVFECDAQLFVNGKQILKGSGKMSLLLKKGDELAAACKRGERWRFAFSGSFCLPFLESEDEFSPATIGVFSYHKDSAPPLNVDLTQPYLNASGEPCFFKYAQQNEYITSELDSCFFGQWFYALMVGEYGLLDAYKLTGNEKYLNYFKHSMSTVANYYYLQKWQKSVFGESAFLQRGMDPADLDSIGSIGMNLCELAAICKNDNAESIIEILYAALSKIPRFEDGVFNRGETMWADDTYMSVPFLLRYAELKNDNNAYVECVRQLLGYRNYLFMQDKNIFSHIFFTKDKMPSRVAWGRGNGWVFVSLSDALQRLPQTIGGYDELVRLFKLFASGIIKLQDESGLWHQVLDMESTYEETSCTGMFVIGLCRGVRLGLLDESVKVNILKAYKGLLKYKIDENGEVRDVCRGSWCSTDAGYYARLGTVDNDDHGTGIILSALYEMNRIFDEDEFETLGGNNENNI